MVEDSFDDIRILARTNTQTRRLGYVKQICRFLTDEPCPRLTLIKRLEEWSERNQYHLEAHINSSGIIRPSGKSLGAKRYIDLANDLELVTDASGYLRLTKTGRILLSVERNEPSSELRPFWLSPGQRLVFVYQLLLRDRDYLLPIFKLASQYHRQPELLEHTQAALLEHFDIIKRKTVSQIIRAQASERRSTFRGWTKPVKYSEHVTIPRLHWLLDLEVLDWQAFRECKEFRPSNIGRVLIESIPNIEGHLFVNREWCQNELFRVWADGLKAPYEQWGKLSISRKRSLIKFYVSTGFSLFRTMEYPRISAYQLVLFTVIELLLVEKILAGFEDVKQALSKYSDSSHEGWIFYWSELDDDGYVLLPR